jgi:diapolycopene oxygenase
MNKIGIVGGGLGGLAAACTLAARGHRVVLFERNRWLGGKAAVLESNGFRFDMGPTILTMPSVLRRIFAEAGRDLNEELDLVRLDPQWRCFYDGGTTLDLWQNSDFGEGHRQFMKLAKRLHEISDRYYFYRPIGGLGDMMSLKPSLLRDVLRMRMGGTVAGTIRSFVSDKRVAQMLDHYTQYVGSAPDQSPAVLCGIASMQASEGVWYPLGGTGAVPAALTRLALDLGVEIRNEVGVQRILHTAGIVAGVETSDGEKIRLDAVVSNMDSVRTHRELLGVEFKRKHEPACSGVVLYLGLKKRYEHLEHHNFVFSRNAEEEFHAIYRQGEPAPDPTCYIAAPARTEPGVAPKGGEALYILVHTPYLRPHHDWKKMLPQYRRVILDKLARTAGMGDLEDRIVFERALTPQDIHERYNVLNGAIYGLASHGRLNGGFKPSNRSKEFRGLYLAGGSAHPGPGMPMALMSGWIAADALHQDFGGQTHVAENLPELVEVV